MSQQFHHIPSLLKTTELIELEQLIPQAAFVDGKATASMAAKEVKNNSQLNAADEVMNAVQKILNGALQSSPYFNVAAQPKKYILLLSVNMNRASIMAGMWTAPLWENRL